MKYDNARQVIEAVVSAGGWVRMIGPGRFHYSKGLPAPVAAAINRLAPEVLEQLARDLRESGRWFCHFCDEVVRVPTTVPHDVLLACEHCSAGGLTFARIIKMCGYVSPVGVN